MSCRADNKIIPENIRFYQMTHDAHYDKTSVSCEMIYTSNNRSRIQRKNHENEKREKWGVVYVPADAHHFTDTLHRGADDFAHAFEFAQIPSRNLGHHIVQGRLETCLHDGYVDILCDEVSGCVV